MKDQRSKIAQLTFSRNDILAEVPHEKLVGVGFHVPEPTRLIGRREPDRVKIVV